jgi:geranylgeranyl diphosphate synthase type I
MAEAKTGALLGCACAIGALFGGASPERVEHLRGFGESLGLAFQFADDLLTRARQQLAAARPAARAAAELDAVAVLATRRDH